MKIASLEAHPLRYDLPRRYGDAQGLKTRRDLIVLKVVSDEGLVGWGELGARLPGPLSQIVSEVAPALVGEDSRDTGRLWRKTSSLSDRRVAAAVEMALLDLKGKATGMPLAQLLGGALRDRQPAYASLQNYGDRPDLREAMVEEAVASVEQGYRMVKMKVGGARLEADLEYVRAVREALPADVPLAVDANQAYHVPLAIRFGREMERLGGVEWLEEPVVVPDLQGYLEVSRALDLTVAGGEGLQSPEALAPFVATRALDLAQPDLVGVGGVSELLRAAAVAQVHHVRLCPHCWAGTIQRVATLHVLATLPDWRLAPLAPDAAPLECDVSEYPLRDELISPPLRPGPDGLVPVPTAPGLGIEVSPEALAKYAWR